VILNFKIQLLTTKIHLIKLSKSINNEGKCLKILHFGYADDQTSFVSVCWNQYLSFISKNGPHKFKNLSITLQPEPYDSFLLYYSEKYFSILARFSEL